MLFSKERVLDQSIIDVGCSVRRVSAILLFYLGELNRIKARFDIHCSNSDVESQQTALTFYNRARVICPHEGKVFH